MFKKIFSFLWLHMRSWFFTNVINQFKHIYICSDIYIIVCWEFLNDGMFDLWLFGL